MAKIGIQIMILRDLVAKNGVYNEMKKVKELGYSCIEISQVPMTNENISEFERAVKDFNLEVAALSVAIDPPIVGAESLSSHFDKYVNLCKEFNCDYLRIGIMPFGCLESTEKFEEFCDKCEFYAKKLAEHNIKLYYHNHHVEFIKHDGKFLLDVMKEKTEKLGFEIDVHWVWRGGAVPQEYIKAYHGRLDLMHLKEYKVIAPDFSRVEKNDREAFLKAFHHDTVRFAEIGEGALDFPQIIEVALEAGSKYLIIEQDNTYGADPYECFKISKENLTKMGYGDMI